MPNMKAKLCYDIWDILREIESPTQTMEYRKILSKAIELYDVKNVENKGQNKLEIQLDNSLDWIYSLEEFVQTVNNLPTRYTVDYVKTSDTLVIEH